MPVSRSGFLAFLLSTSIAAGAFAGADVSVALATEPYALAGRAAAFALTFRNDGPETAQNVTAYIVLSSGVTFDPSSDCSATCSAGDLALGATVTKTLRIVAGSGVANASLTTTATSSTPDLNPADNSASAAIRVYPAVADLAITAAPPPCCFGVGSEIPIIASVANRGPAPTPATLTFFVPPGLQLLRGNGCSVAGSNATCTSAEIAPGTAAVFTLVFLAATPGYYRMDLHAASALSDPNPADNDAVVNFGTAIADPPPPPFANLAVSVFPTEVTAEPGAPVAFGIVVTNRGGSFGSGISVALTSPLKLVSLSSSKADCDAASAHCTIQQINVGESVAIHAIVDAPASGSATVDVDAANRTASLRVIAVDHPRRRPSGH